MIREAFFQYYEIAIDEIYDEYLKMCDGEREVPVGYADEEDWYDCKNKDLDDIASSVYRFNENFIGK